MRNRWSSWMVDAVLPAVLGGFVLGVTTAVARYQHSARSLDFLGYLWLFAPAVALLWRRRLPLPVFVATAVAVWTYYYSPYPGGPAAVYSAAALFTLALLRGPVPAGAAGGALITALVIADLLVRPAHSWSQLGGITAGVAAVVAAGTAARSRRAWLAARQDQAEEHARRLAEQERLRIAREVHDVVAHSLAMINVQAGVGAHVADKRPDQAKQALLAIKEASRAALTDLRATLGVLRSGDLAPTPSLARLTELVDSVTAAGLTATVDGAPGELPAPVDVAAYRILQESLTNTVRHAQGASEVFVRFTRADDTLELVVTDDGAADAAPHSGNGLRGMRERATAVGGTLTAGPRAGGGFQVRAVLPVRGVAE